MTFDSSSEANDVMNRWPFRIGDLAVGFIAGGGMSIFMVWSIATTEPPRAEDFVAIDGFLRDGEISGGREPHVDLYLTDREATFRIGSGQWKRISDRDSLWQTLRRGIAVSLHVERANMDDPLEREGLQIVFVDAIAVEGHTFYSVEERVAWGQTDRRYLWALAIVLPIATVFLGVLLYGRIQIARSQGRSGARRLF